MIETSDCFIRTGFQIMLKRTEEHLGPNNQPVLIMRILKQNCKTCKTLYFSVNTFDLEPKVVSYRA